MNEVGRHRGGGGRRRWRGGGFRGSWFGPRPYALDPFWGGGSGYGLDELDRIELAIRRLEARRRRILRGEP